MTLLAGGSICTGVWRSSMAPIYEGVPFEPELTAPPPAPPPIEGLKAINSSVTLLELARSINALCARGSMGVLCSSCEARWFPSYSGECLECSVANFQPHPVLIVLVSFAGPSLLYTLWQRRRLRLATAKWPIVRWQRRLKLVLNWDVLKVACASHTRSWGRHPNPRPHSHPNRALSNRSPSPRPRPRPHPSPYP